MIRLFFYPLFFLYILCITVFPQSDITVDIFVHDHYTEAPLEAAIVSVLHNGVVVDSSYTDSDGRTQVKLSLTRVNEGQTIIPNTFSMSENYPNPFKDETQVDFAISEHQTVRAEVYNLLGQRMLSDEFTLSSGYFTMNLSLSHLPTGVYFLRFRGKAGGAIKLMKIGGDVLYDRGVLHRGSIQVTSRSAIDLPLQKTTVESGEFTVQIEKDRYEPWSVTKQLESGAELIVPLERCNEVVLLVEYDERIDFEHDLEITGITDDEFKLAIISPDTVILKSGVYRIDGATDTTWVENILEISSIDTTVVLNANGTVSDIDGNSYKIVKIGDQWWMRENLKTTRYADGTEIPGVYAYENDESHAEDYGRLYTWEGVMNGAASSNANTSGVQGVCPAGWHVPSDEEWKQLEMYLGMTQEQADDIGWRETVSAGKLKSTRTEPDTHPRWNSPNTGATNDSRFSAFPGGYRNNMGDFHLKGRFGYWWSSTESFTDVRAWYRGLDYGFGGMLRYTTDKHNGLSARCVSD